MNRINEVCRLSSLTGRTFVSGLKEQEGNPSLLLWLKRERKRILTLKDFGTVLNLPPTERNQVLSQLREIYDGEFNAAYGTGEKVHWNGKLGLIACATPAVDSLHKWSTELGERFVQYRPYPANPDRVTDRVRANQGREREMRQGLQAAFLRAFLQGIRSWRENGAGTKWDDQVCSALGKLVAEARTPVKRNRYTQDFEAAEPEGPARLTGVFEQLYRAAWICHGRDIQSAATLVRRIAVDSIAPEKRRLLLSEVAKKRWGITLDGLDDLLRCSRGTVRRHLEDLEALGLVENRGEVKKAIYQASGSLLNLASDVFGGEYQPADALEKLFDRYNNLTHEGEEEEKEQQTEASLKVLQQ